MGHMSTNSRVNTMNSLPGHLIEAHISPHMRTMSNQRALRSCFLPSQVITPRLPGDVALAIAMQKLREGSGILDQVEVRWELIDFYDSAFLTRHGETGLLDIQVGNLHGLSHVSRGLTYRQAYFLLTQKKIHVVNLVTWDAHSTWRSLAHRSYRGAGADSHEPPGQLLNGNWNQRQFNFVH